jgi:hypothetical protein
MRVVIVALAGLLIAAASSVAAGETEERVFGDGLTIEQATPISTLLAAPQDYAGKTIRIEGVITEVCARHGDWLKVATPRSGSGILVKVDGAGMTFPPDCVTRRISVQGVVEAGGNETASTSDDRHEDEDPPHVCAAMTREGVRFYLRVTGAVIYRPSR